MPFGDECQFPDMAACIAAHAEKDDPSAYCAALMRDTEEACRAKQVYAKALRARHKLADDATVGCKTLKAEFEIEDDDRFTARITSAALDDDNEVVLPSGGDFSRFKVSGPILWGHDQHQPVALSRGLSANDAEIVGKATWLKRPADWEGSWQPDFAKAFVSQSKAVGLSPGVSIGFLRIERRDPTAKDLEMFGSTICSVVNKWRLLEWSIAPVQCNPDAVVTMVGKHLISSECAKALFNLDVPEVEIVEQAPTVVTISEAQSTNVVIVQADRAAAKHLVIVLPAPAVQKRTAGPSRAELIGAAVQREMARRRGALYG